MNYAILLFGSNINPKRNIQAALNLIGDIKAKSRIWKTKTIGSDGPDFLNIAVEIETSFNVRDIKEKIVTTIEKKLKRVRTADKNAPRTIDIDLIIFNEEVVDDDLWNKAFVAIPMSELRPDIIHPLNKVSLLEHAQILKSSASAELYIQ